MYSTTTVFHNGAYSESYLYPEDVINVVHHIHQPAPSFIPPKRSYKDLSAKTCDIISPCGRFVLFAGGSVTVISSWKPGLKEPRLYCDVQFYNEERYTHFWTRWVRDADSEERFLIAIPRVGEVVDTERRSWFPNGKMMSNDLATVRFDKTCPKEFGFR